MDFGRVPLGESGARPALPGAAWDAVARAGVGFAGAGVLDVGSGHGPEARALAARGARVVASDVAHALLVLGRELDGAPRVRADAAALPHPDAVFDVLTACQCWWWFDGPRAAAEARRVLRPGGHLVVLAYDWLPLPGNVVEATEALIEAHNPAWTLGGGDGRHPEWDADVAGAGFDTVERFAIDTTEPFPHAAWRARIRASAGVGASLDAAGIAAFDAALAARLARDFPGELAVAHRVAGLVARVR